MSNETFDELLVQVKTLAPDQQRTLHGTLSRLLTQQSEAENTTSFHDALMAAGLVKTIKNPQSRERLQRKLVPVNGKPVSETIIEERR